MFPSQASPAWAPSYKVYCMYKVYLTGLRLSPAVPDYWTYLSFCPYHHTLMSNATKWWHNITFVKLLPFKGGGNSGLTFLHRLCTTYTMSSSPQVAPLRHSYFTSHSKDAAGDRARAPRPLPRPLPLRHQELRQVGGSGCSLCQGKLSIW